MAKLNAYLRFKDNAREAMEYYKSCLGGELRVDTFGASPGMEQISPEMKDRVMHSELRNTGVILMGSDSMPEQGELTKGNMIYLCLVCESKEEIERLFLRLSDGGRVIQPLVEAFFGTYGELEDKYGVSWMFQFSAQTQ